MSGILLLLSGVAWAVGLEEVRATATQQAVAVEQARAARDAASARAWIATAESLPSVVGFGSVNTGAGFTAFGFPRPVQTQAGAGIRASWTLLSPSAWGAARAARQTAAGQDAMVAWAMVEARRAATTGFSETRGAQAVLDALGTARDDAANAVDAVRGQVEAGLRPAADAARAEAELATLEAELAAARGDARTRCAALLALLRQPVEGECVLEGMDPTAPEAGPASHPALDAARATLGARRGSEAVARGQILPSLQGTGSAAWYTTDQGSGGVGWSTGLDLSVPLLAVGAGAKGIAAARAETAIAELALEDQERALRVALASAEARLGYARAALAARTRALEAAEAALALTGERYANGLAPLTDWIDARRQRDTASIARARSTAELGSALAELEAARGVH